MAQCRRYGDAPGITVVAAALVLLAGPVRAAPAVPIESLTIEMAPADVKKLAEKDPFEEFTLPITVVDGGRRLHGRAEIKGSSTRILPKKGLLIKLDDGATWRGDSRIVVDSRATDRTLMRDYLAWDLWRRLGMPAPEVHYLRLALNDANHGVYLRVGWITPRLFEKDSVGGELYQATDRHHCGNLSPASVEEVERCYAKVGPRDDKFDALEQLVAALDAAPADRFHEFVERTFDTESVINWLVVNTVISNRDTYDKNYFLYRSTKTGKWQVLPFDFDLSQGTDYMPEYEYPKNVLASGVIYWHPLEQKLVNLPSPLREKALKNEVLRGRVRARLGELIDGAPGKAKPWAGWLAPATLQARIATLHRVLRPLVAKDPHLAKREAQFDEAVEALSHYYRGRLLYLRKMVVRDDALRIRDEATAPLPATGGVVDLVDEGGFLLASLALRAAKAGGDVDLRVRRSRPEQVPGGVDGAACVQRTWTISVSVKAQADLTLEYHQDPDRPSELGSQVTDERKLRLYAALQGGSSWRALPSALNVAANTLTTRALTLPAGEALTLVACEAAAR